MRARVTGGFTSTARGDRIDWQAVRDTISLADVAIRLLGRPPAAAGSDRPAVSGGIAPSTRIRIPHSASNKATEDGDAGDAAQRGMPSSWHAD